MKHLSIAPRFARSANLERDTTAAAPLDGYVVTARALDVVERIAATAATGQAGGAWSITGPYGSGKSSLAVLLDGVFGETGEVRDKALALISEISPTVGLQIIDAHERYSTLNTGFHRAAVTATRESISHTVLRSLHSAVLGRFGKIPPASKFAATPALKAALADAANDDPRRAGPSPAALLEIARCLAAEAPLLIIIDEFGKNLEAIDQSSDTDPYLLQQLAEAGQGNGLPIFTLTLQHLSFEDYFVGKDGPQQREWAKVQGRFEDIPYIDSPTQTRALIATVFEPDTRLSKRIRTWATELAQSRALLGIEDLSAQAVIASCYPLHPLTAAVLPHLCSTYGQNERTLFSFLTGPDQTAVPAVLARTESVGSKGLPVVDLSHVYDYFVRGGLITGASGAQSSRWTEIVTRLRDTHGLSNSQSDVAKTIAVLNLVSASGTLRASKQLIELLHPGSGGELQTLEELGLVTYRDFAAEYRIWQGSDVNIQQLVEIAQTRISQQPLAETLKQFESPDPVVAARHSAQNDVMRVFSRRYVTGDEALEALSPFSEVDGEALLVVGPDRTCPDAPQTGGPAKPVVAAIPHDISTLDDAARSLAAVQTVLDLPEVAEDRVARRELGEQLAQTEATFRTALVATFTSEECDWFLLEPDGPRLLASGRGSAAISSAADIAYPQTPRIGNEMINRTEVTSQGARARRRLLEGMIENPTKADLGFEGFGPEVAMYRSLLGRSGIHRTDHRNETLVFAAPQDPSLQPAWLALENEFDRARTRRINLNDVYATLMSPPIGMKAAAIPVLVTAGLLAHADEVAIYEHGTFKPILGADVSERMVKNPSHFDIKHFANTSGARRKVVDELAEALGVAKRFRKHRVSNVLAIVGHLVGAIGRLDNYTLKTDELSEKTIAVRDALKTAVEPDELLFEHLPKALGFPPVAASKAYPKARMLARAVALAQRELDNNLDGLLNQLADDLLELAAETKSEAVAGQAAALQDEVLDPEVRSFVLTVANIDIGNKADWISAIATVVSKKAVAEWGDEDRARFGLQLPVRVAAFQRIMALHSDRRAVGGQPFDARRLTITLADGREDYRLVAAEGSERKAGEAALEIALQEIAVVTGSEAKALHVMLALLSERILPTVIPAIDTSVIDLTSERAANG